MQQSIRTLLTSEALQDHVAFWEEQLRMAAEPFVFRSPFGIEENPQNTVWKYRCAVEYSVTEILRHTANNNPLATFVLLFTSAAYVLHRTSSASTVVVDSPLLIDGECFPGFEGPLPVPLRIDDTLTIDQLLTITKTTLSGTYSFQNFPVADMLKNLGRPDVTTNVLISCEPLHAPLEKRDVYDLHISFILRDENIELCVMANPMCFHPDFPEVFARQMIAFMAHYKKRATILPAVQLMSYQYDRQISAMPEDNQQNRLYRSVAQHFDAVVNTMPDRIALITCDHVHLSYRMLDEAASRLAACLVGRNVRRGDLIVVVSDKTDLQIVALLATLKLDAVYVPIDGALPVKRIEAIVEDARPKIVLTHAIYLSKLDTLYKYPVFVLDVEDSGFTLLKSGDQLDQEADSPFYAIYTSGSTGIPKGVLIGQQGFLNMIQCQINGFGIVCDDNVIQFASPGFDASMSEIFMALLSGAKLILPSSQIGADPVRLFAFLEQEKISVATFPPIFSKVVAQHRTRSLNTIVSAGETMRRKDVRLFRHARRVFNAYGPTEMSVCTSFKEIDDACATYFEIMPIGLPIANTNYYILDERNYEVPDFVKGQLYISGSGISLGYLNLPELTSLQFIEHPFEKGKRLYRTGDIAMRLPDNQIVILGRSDEQIKFHGFRIEPGEIEKIMRSFPGVSEAVVINVNSHDVDSVLVGFYTGRMSETESIRTFLVERLPAYMVPSHIIDVAAIPVTINGKVDQKALVTEFFARMDTEQLLPEELNATEVLLMEIWTAVLGRRSIRTSDSFFDLGGTSISVMTLVSKFNERSNAQLLKVSDLYHKPTIKGLAEAVIRRSELLTEVDKNSIAQ